MNWDSKLWDSLAAKKWRPKPEYSKSHPEEQGSVETSSYSEKYIKSGASKCPNCDNPCHTNGAPHLGDDVLTQKEYCNGISGGCGATWKTVYKPTTAVICPECGSSELAYSHVNFADTDEQKVHYECEGCSDQFDILYKATGITDFVV